VSSGVSSTGPIVVDTTVFGARLIKTRAALAKQYQHHVAGREAHISFVTEAELRFGARWAGWGEARLYRLEAVLASADVVLPGPELIEAYVNLRHQCLSTGHGLAQRRPRGHYQPAPRHPGLYRAVLRGHRPHGPPPRRG